LSRPRYVPTRAFPPYAFVPGRHPHPTRDPGGHSYANNETASELDFAWGVDLYNHGYFWEAHEAWEGLWGRAEPSSAEADLLQGLIQCAAACLKLRIGERQGAERLAARGIEHLRQAAAAGAERGAVDAGAFATAFAAFVASRPTDVEGRPSLRMSLQAGRLHQRQ
jgi:uncharacterized protein